MRYEHKSSFLCFSFFLSFLLTTFIFIYIYLFFIFYIQAELEQGRYDSDSYSYRIELAVLRNGKTISHKKRPKKFKRLSKHQQELDSLMDSALSDAYNLRNTLSGDVERTEIIELDATKVRRMKENGTWSEKKRFIGVGMNMGKGEPACVSSEGKDRGK